jgi:hypothetical protein
MLFSFLKAIRLAQQSGEIVEALGHSEVFEA